MAVEFKISKYSSIAVVFKLGLYIREKLCF